jgi:hypothetical protein
MTGAGEVAQRLAAVRTRLADLCRQAGRPGDAVELLAVSKQQPAESVRAAHAAGQRAFGENRVQELVAKARDLADLPDLRWHMIGSLQTNKVRDLLRTPGLALLHSLDRERLADELQRELERLDRRLEVLLELHVTDEPGKHGCAPAAAPDLCDHVLARCPRLVVRGVMAMGPLAGDPAPAFARAAAVLASLRVRSGLALPVLSLGMSGDVAAAVAAGSTLVRIGTAVFGPRG